MVCLCMRRLKEMTIRKKATCVVHSILFYLIPIRILTIKQQCEGDPDCIPMVLMLLILFLHLAYTGNTSPKLDMSGNISEHRRASVNTH